jgi:hypothetical protein
MVQDPVGDAAHQDRRHRPLAPATDDDQVGLELVRGPDDLVGGLAAADDGVHLRSRVPELLRDSFHGRSCRQLERVGPWVARALGGCVLLLAEVARERHGGQGTDHGDHRDPVERGRVEEPEQVPGRLERLFRTVGSDGSVN